MLDCDMLDCDMPDCDMADCDMLDCDMAAAITLWGSGDPPDCSTDLARGLPVVVVANTNTAAARRLIEASIFPGDELDRAARFRFARNRAEFLLARGIVRTVLAAELAVAPHDVPFGAPANEKPRVGRDAGRRIDVSISHSAGWVACGFAAGRSIGVDVEEDDGRTFDVTSLAPRIMTAQEQLLFAGLGAPQREAWFLDAWRCKEAVLKAAGLGLAGNPASIEVLRRHADGTMAICDTVTAAAQRWHLHVETPRDGPTVAVALAERIGLAG